MTQGKVHLVSRDAEATRELGRALAGWLRDGDVVLLHGDLGAGKTTLAKGIADALRVDAVVSSPSFALVNEYDTGLAAPISRLYHLDLYRIEGSDELASIGYSDLTAPAEGVTLVEWPERAADELPDRYLLVTIEAALPDERNIEISHVPDDETWRIRMDDLRQRLARYAP